MKKQPLVVTLSDLKAIVIILNTFIKNQVLLLINSESKVTLPPQEQQEQTDLLTALVESGICHLESTFIRSLNRISI